MAALSWLSLITFSNVGDLVNTDRIMNTEKSDVDPPPSVIWQASDWQQFQKHPMEQYRYLCRKLPKFMSTHDINMMLVHNVQWLKLTVFMLCL